MSLEHHEPESEKHPAGASDQVAADQGANSGSDLSLIAAMFQPPQPQAPQNAPPQKTHNWRDNVKLGLEAVGLVALIIYTIFSVLQWAQIRWTNRLTREALNGSNDSLTQTLTKMQSQINEMHTLATNTGTQATQTANLAETSRNALIQTQRAVMAVTTVDASREAGPDGKVANISMFLRWKNVGATPTKKLAFRHNFLPTPQRLPDNFVYADIPDAPGTNSDTPSFAAPQGSVSATPIKIPVIEAQEIVDKKLVLTMWGHADYWDVFKGTPRHTSEYCFIVTGFYGNIYSTNANEFTVPITENCKTHNCHDEECKEK